MEDNELKRMPDWMVRAIKTFVQAFFGVLVPEVVVLLNKGWPESWSALWGVLAPVMAAALAAAISAVWNIWLEQSRKAETRQETERRV